MKSRFRSYRRNNTAVQLHASRPANCAGLRQAALQLFLFLPRKRIFQLKQLKNPYTIEINRIDCYIKPSNSGLNQFHDEVYFTVNCSAENNFGGKVTTIIGNYEGIELDSDFTYDFIGSIYADTWYFVKDETYAKDQEDSFTLDAKEIQEYILENY